MSKIDAIEHHMSEILKILEVKIDDSTKDTARRVAKMYVNELFAGLDKSNYPKVTAVDNKFHYDQMIIVKDIKVHSLCEHHLVPFMGTAAIAYIPKDKVLGLSKFNRIVDHFARRPQIQERLTMDIHYELVDILGTDNVAVLIKAEHLCVKLRGIKDQGSETITSMLKGVFRQEAPKQEFLACVR